MLSNIKLDDIDTIRTWCCPEKHSSDTRELARSVFSTGFISCERAFHYNVPALCDVFMAGLPVVDCLFRYPLEEWFAHQGLLDGLDVQYTFMEPMRINIDFKHKNRFLARGFFCESSSTAANLVQHMPAPANCYTNDMIVFASSSDSFQIFIKSMTSEKEEALTKMFSTRLADDRIIASYISLNLAKILLLACTNQGIPTEFVDIIDEWICKQTEPNMDLYSDHFALTRVDLGEEEAPSDETTLSSDPLMCGVDSSSEAPEIAELVPSLILEPAKDIECCLVAQECVVSDQGQPPPPARSPLVQPPLVQSPLIQIPATTSSSSPPNLALTKKPKRKRVQKRRQVRKGASVYDFPSQESEVAIELFKVFYNKPSSIAAAAWKSLMENQRKSINTCFFSMFLPF